MSLTCLDHRMLNTRTRQFIVNLLEVKLWMVRHWCMEYLYSTKIYVYKKMKMIWLQLQLNLNKCSLSLLKILRLWIETHIWTYIKYLKCWRRRILIYTFSFCINYLKKGFMTFFVAYHYSAITSATKLLIVFYITTLRYHFKRIHRLINWWILSASHKWKKMNLFFLYY